MLKIVDSLIDKALELKNHESVRVLVTDRLDSFSSHVNKPSEEWFSELCFCLLTSNSKAQTALNIQNELKANGFINYSPEEIRGTIIKHKHRFHNNKTKFIVNARDHIDIKDKISDIALESQVEAREWLVKNIKGFGYKEASHFLRNVGYFDLAILDRHILNLLLENNFISEKPKTLNKNKYLEIETIFRDLANKSNMSCAELDFYMWYMKVGAVLK